MALRKRKPQGPVVSDPFAVIPIQPENVDQRRDSEGKIHLRLRIEPEGFAKKVAVWLRYDYSKKIELDAYGSLFYSCVDGETTLDTIVERMREQLDVDRKTAEEAVVLFTKRLMMMNMIALKVPESAQTNVSGTAPAR